jgi:4-carboxymuconolactone decarboxylase
MDPPYLTWKSFDRELANDFSMFITGNLYSRTVLTLPERQMAACAILGAIRATDELKLHVNAALNVGCDPRKLTEIFFQMAPYAGMPLSTRRLPSSGKFLKNGENGQLPGKQPLSKASPSYIRRRVNSSAFDNSFTERSFDGETAGEKQLALTAFLSS